MIIEKPTKNMKAICAKLCETLEKPYTIRVMDFEQVVYRDFGNGYDVEISGLNNNRKKMDVNIYVWQYAPSLRTVEKFWHISSFDELADTLTKIETKYSVL